MYCILSVTRWVAPLISHTEPGSFTTASFSLIIHFEPIIEGTLDNVLPIQIPIGSQRRQHEGLSAPQRWTHHGSQPNIHVRLLCLSNTLDCINQSPGFLDLNIDPISELSDFPDIILIGEGLICHDFNVALLGDPLNLFPFFAERGGRNVDLEGLFQTVDFTLIVVFCDEGEDLLGCLHRPGGIGIQNVKGSDIFRNKLGQCLLNYSDVILKFQFDEGGELPGLSGVFDLSLTYWDRVKCFKIHVGSLAVNTLQ